MTKTEKEILSEINHKLKMILKMRVEEKLDEYDTNKEKVKLLSGMGFDNEEMAELIGTSKGSVRGSLSALREEDEIDD